MPSRATTSTMPEPMRPQPTIPTVRTSSASTTLLGRPRCRRQAYNRRDDRSAASPNRRQARRRRRGLVLGHWLAYALARAARQRARRAAARHRPRVSGVRDPGRGARRHARARRPVPRSPAPAGGRRVVRPRRRPARGAVQTGAFVAMEVGERLLSGAPLHDLTHGSLLVIGLAVQLVVATAGAALLRLTDRTAEPQPTACAAIVRSPPDLPSPPSWCSVAACSPPARPSLRQVRRAAPLPLPAEHGVQPRSPPESTGPAWRRSRREGAPS